VPSTRAAEPRLIPLVWVLAPAVLAALVLGGFVLYAALTPYSSQEQPPGRHGALLWGDGMFANTLELKGWLRLHGASYAAWKKRHPSALRLVTPLRPVESRRALQARRPAAAKPAGAATPARRKPASRAAAATAPEARRNWVVLALAALGLLIVAASTLPAFVLARIGVSRRDDFRIHAAATGVSVLVGVLVATIG
jgi:hypothetical protein